MAKIPLSSSQSLNILLSVIIVVGGFAAYEFGHFDGVSFDELGEKYISKSDVKFSDLPRDVQKRYIDKEATLEQNKEASDLLEDTYLDEQGKPIPESEVTPQDMKRLIAKLQKTLLFLQHDNLLITNEKNELAKKLDEQENERESEKAELQSKNTERLNEAEQQHYRNISDLTMKINELQKENVVISQKANLEANALRSQIDELKSQAVEAETRKGKEIQKAREEEQAKLSDYKEKIKLLNDQISLLNEQIANNNDTAKNAFMRKQDEIDKLKNQLDLAAKEKNELLSKQTQNLLAADQKHKDEIAQYVRTIEQLKADTETLIAKNRQEMSDQEQIGLKKLAVQEEKIKGLNAELASAQKHVDALILENEKDFNKFKTYLEDEKKLNKELTAGNKKLEENAQAMEKSLNDSLLKHKEELAKKEIVIQELNDKIAKLNNDKLNVEAEVKRRVDENDKVHNKNYKIFNEKIASFEASKKALTENLDKQLAEYKASAKETYDRVQFHTEELTRANEELKQKMSAKDQELQNAKNQLVALKLEQQKAQDTKDASLKSAQSTLETLRGETKQKEEAYLLKIQTLEADLRAKEATVAAAKKDETLKIAALEKEIKTKAVEMQALRDENSRHESALKTLQVKIKDMEDSATKTSNKQIEELKAKLAQTEKNRATENTQLVDLKDTLRAKEIEYLDALKEKDKAFKAKETQLSASKEEIKKISAAHQSGEEEIKKLKEELKQKEFKHLEETKTLQNELKVKESTLNGNQKQETLKSIALEKELKQKELAFAQEKDALSKRLAASEQSLKTLNEKLALLEASESTKNAPKTAAATSTPSKPAGKGQKPVFVDSIMCTDMGTGVNAISEQCKQNVQAFLGKYDGTYFFEVAPIVDNGGFASLKLIKSKKVGVEDSEIDRISSLANIGLGKARAKAGGELIETFVGEGAKISYALSNVEKDKSKGFLIKVYR
ncbi:hypothetical protein [Sulfurospirillum cavolei]|uniref:hypothetical protein n=1 Tax=Sulfurospirillum cavolei TaxID=366522 RepID=UPI0005A6080C|nr:hypothetical protein [Sulfurospirillum cavolei]